MFKIAPAKRRYLSPYFLSLLMTFGVALTAPQRALAQGCIAIKNDPGTPLMEGNFDQGIEPSQWVSSVAYRWYTSNRHFSGDVEQVQRHTLGNYVENRVHFVDVSESYGIDDRWSVTLDVPYIHANRSSLYEHDLVNRYHMRSQGLGDLRLTSDYWIFDPKTHKSGNIALGVGLKLPTGNDAVTDIAHRASGPVQRPVDPSIQPGDGGWGYIVQIQAYQKLSTDLTAYATGSYMVTPQEQNSTELTIADVPAFAALITNDIRHDTIADQYSARAGLSYYVLPNQGLSVSVGYRLEGIPAKDLIGGSMGFRRPGYTESVEPGLNWTHRSTSLSLSVPIAFYRNRIQSAPEEKLGRPAGDAAFANYSIIASINQTF